MPSQHPLQIWKADFAVPGRFTHPLLARYDALAASGAIERDDAQVAILRNLEQLAKTINENARGGPVSILLASSRMVMSILNPFPKTAVNKYKQSPLKNKKKTNQRVTFWGNGRGLQKLKQLTR